MICQSREPLSLFFPGLESQFMYFLLLWQLINYDRQFEVFVQGASVPLPCWVGIPVYLALKVTSNYES